MAGARFRYIALEIAEERLVAKLKRIAGAYRLGNLSFEQAMKQAEKAFDDTFYEVLSFADKVIVTRDLGPHRGLISQQKSALKRKSNEIVKDFEKVLKLYKYASTGTTTTTEPPSEEAMFAKVVLHQEHISDLSFFQEGAAEDFWGKLPQLQSRVDMIGGQFTFRVNNGALAFFADANYAGLEWVGYLDDKTCKICEPRIAEGKVYKKGQFIPKLPAHIHCRCTWRLIPNASRVPAEAKAEK